MTQNKTVRPFGMRDKMGYLAGDTANLFTFMLTSILLTKFYTDVMGVNVAVVGTIMMLARFIDAFTDMIMGRICDKARPTKAGKYRPWILRMCIPVTLSSFLIYQSGLASMPMGLKIAYLAVTYITWSSICYTGMTIPFGSMATVISPEPADRASLSVVRSLGSTLATLVGSVLAPMVVFKKVSLADGSVKETMIGSRVTIFAGVFSLLAVVGYLICYFVTVERIQAPQLDKSNQPSLVQTMKKSFTNKSLMALIGTSVFAIIAQLTMLNMFIYVFPDYYGNASAQAMVNLLGVLVMVLAMITTKPLSMRFGKAELCIFSCILSGALCLITWIMRPESVWVFATLQVLVHIGLGYITATSWAMIADVIDDIEVKEGSCQVGNVFALSGFARKMGQALTIGLTGWILGAIGYDSMAASTGQLQSQSVLDGIFNITCLLPLAAYILLGITLWLVYPLKKKRVEENAKTLRRRRSE